MACSTSSHGIVLPSLPAPPTNPLHRTVQLLWKTQAGIISSSSMTTDPASSHPNMPITRAVTGTAQRLTRYKEASLYPLGSPVPGVTRKPLRIAHQRIQKPAHKRGAPCCCSHKPAHANDVRCCSKNQSSASSSKQGAAHIDWFSAVATENGARSWQKKGLPCIHAAVRFG